MINDWLLSWRAGHHNRAEGGYAIFLSRLRMLLTTRMAITPPTQIIIMIMNPAWFTTLGKLSDFHLV
jgi:hypothetical protein